MEKIKKIIDWDGSDIFQREIKISMGDVSWRKKMKKNTNNNMGFI